MTRPLSKLFALPMLALFCVPLLVAQRDSAHPVALHPGRVALSITPASAEVFVGESLNFTAGGAAARSVIWNVLEGAAGGSITPQGLYTAPQVPGTYHVLATSRIARRLSVSAVVTVSAPPALQGTFTLTGSMNVPRAGHTATLLPSGKVLVTGGLAGASTTATAELFDPATQTFTFTGSMATPRQLHAATLLSDGRVLVTGGIVTAVPYDYEATAAAEIYDPALGTFAPAGDMFERRYGHTATLLPDGRVLIASGYTPSEGCWPGYGELFNPATGTFSPAGMATPFYQAATALPSGAVLLSGGGYFCDGYGPFPWTAALQFDPLNDVTWLVGWLSPRGLHTATLLTGGRVLLAGGTCFPLYPEDTCEGTPSAELFDPQTGLSAATGPMLVRPYFGHTATLLSDGSVLVLGAFAFGQQVSQRFLPASETFVAAADLNENRMLLTATRLLDGRVLVTGGVNYPNILASAELYE